MTFQINLNSYLTYSPFASNFASSCTNFPLFDPLSHAQAFSIDSQPISEVSIQDVSRAIPLHISKSLNYLKSSIENFEWVEK